MACETCRPVPVSFCRTVSEDCRHRPLEYLTHWRMQLAARMLRDTRRTVLSIALEAGYRSDAALIRAFDREFGTTPARWRRAGEPKRASARTG
ncbi:MAG: helix-turn-helix domain-containing protein [Steroidobacteraceae bacterium]